MPASGSALDTTAPACTSDPHWARSAQARSDRRLAGSQVQALALGAGLGSVGWGREEAERGLGVGFRGWPGKRGQGLVQERTRCRTALALRVQRGESSVSRAGWG